MTITSKDCVYLSNRWMGTKIKCTGRHLSSRAWPDVWGVTAAIAPSKANRQFSLPPNIARCPHLGHIYPRPRHLIHTLSTVRHTCQTNCAA
jgi:hypothetical protein